MHNKIFIAIYSAIILTCFTSFSTKNAHAENTQFEDFSITCDTDDFDCDIPDFNIEQLRSFEQAFEPAELSLSEKLEMFLAICKLKTRGYHNEFLTNLSQHGNEYLVGATCVATMFVAALLKHYINNSKLIVHESR